VLGVELQQPHLRQGGRHVRKQAGLSEGLDAEERM
jgi:hypothetical protein